MLGNRPVVANGSGNTTVEQADDAMVELGLGPAVPNGNAHRCRHGALVKAWHARMSSTLTG